MYSSRKMSNKRTSLSVWKKYEIVEEVNRRTDTPVSMLAKELEISRTSLITILKNKEKIIEEFEAGCSSETKQKRKHNFETVDELLMKWFCQAMRRKNSSQWGNVAVESSRVCRSSQL